MQVYLGTLASLPFTLFPLRRPFHLDPEVLLWLHKATKVQTSYLSLSCPMLGITSMGEKNYLLHLYSTPPPAHVFPARLRNCRIQLTTCAYKPRLQTYTRKLNLVTLEGH